jgi:hypothetical protein
VFHVQDAHLTLVEHLRKDTTFRAVKMITGVSVKPTLISSALVLASAFSAFAQDSTTNIIQSQSISGNATIKVGAIAFSMVVSQAAKNCLPNAQAQIQIRTSDTSDTADDLSITAAGLPSNAEFDLFVIQVPNAPFGLSWYQGDLETDDNGNAMQHFRGRFSVQTFIVAPGVAAAPLVFNDPPFPDAGQSPATGPVQTYHLGLWFNSPADAQNAGCPNTVTPFNGEHNAGIQVLNTSNFPDNSGPLRNLIP